MSEFTLRVPFLRADPSIILLEKVAWGIEGVKNFYFLQTEGYDSNLIYAPPKPDRIRDVVDWESLED